MNTKERLSAAVDAALIRAAEQAVKRGLAPSVSAWVNDALELKLAHQGRLERLSAFIEEYEKEYGEISDKEIRGAMRRAHQTASGPGVISPGARSSRKSR